MTKEELRDAIARRLYESFRSGAIVFDPWDKITEQAREAWRISIGTEQLLYTVDEYTTQLEPPKITWTSENIVQKFGISFGRMNEQLDRRKDSRRSVYHPDRRHGQLCNLGAGQPGRRMHKDRRIWHQRGRREDEQ